MVVGHGVNGLIAAGDGHILERQIAVVLDHYCRGAVPARGVLGGLGALGHADDLAVLEGDLVVFKQLEGIRSSTGAADQHTADGVGIAAEVNGQALVVKRLRLDLNSVAVAALQQLHGIAVLRRRDSLREGLITGIADCSNDIRIENSYTVNYQLASCAGNKAAVQIRLALRSCLVSLSQGIIAFSSISNANFTNISRTHNHANTPTAVIGGVQFAVSHCIISKGKESCGVATGMTNNTTNRALCSDLCIFN